MDKEWYIEAMEQMSETSNYEKTQRKLKCTLLSETSEKAMAPTPVLSPGKSHGWRSLVGCSPWGR